jgi:glycosyltransferase involved in cell wall biosynthesis
LKLCFVNPALQKRSEIYKVADSISPRHEVTILQPDTSEKSRANPTVSHSNVTVRRLPARFITFQDSVFVLPSLGAWSDALKGFDLIHICDYFYTTSFLPFLHKTCPVTLVTNALPGYSYSTGSLAIDGLARIVTGTICPNLLPRYDRVNSVTTSLVDDLVAFGVRRDKISVIPSGVDWQPLDRDREDVRREYDIGKDETVMMVMGRHVRVKRFDLAIKTAKQLGARLLVLGTGPQKPHLESFARSIGADCTFFDFAPEKVKLDCFAMSDLFLLTSLSEGLPTTALEAMANGLPVVSNDLPGMRDMITQRGTGILVSDGDYAGACSRLLADRDLRDSISANAASLIRTTRSWKVIGGRYDRFFEDAAQ